MQNVVHKRCTWSNDHHRDQLSINMETTKLSYDCAEKERPFVGHL